MVDSSLLSDDHDVASLTDEVGLIVDTDRHPLCDTAAFSMHESLTSLPCCLSTHCLARHGSFLPPSPPPTSQPIAVPDESFLLLDSTYNAVAILVSLDTYRNKGISAISAQAEQYSAVGEITGSRIRATQETMYWDLLGTRYSPSSTTVYPTATNSSQDSSQEWPKLAWVMPSCLTHSFILPSLELEHLECQQYTSSGDIQYDDEEHKQYHNMEVCRDTGVGMTGKIGDLGVTLWLDINTWNYASVNGTSVKDTVGRFVSSNGVSALLPDNESVGLLMDDCAGPNCVTDNQPHACQPLLELENTYHEVNFSLRAIWF